MTGQLDAVPVDLVPSIREAVAAVTRMARQMAEAVGRAVTTIRAALDRWNTRLREAANHPVTIAGLEARYAVRAGLSPAYRDPADLDRLVAAIMRGHGDTLREDRELRLVSRANRSLIAASAITGWCYSYGDGPAILAWHRLMGTTTVVVTRG